MNFKNTKVLFFYKGTSHPQVIDAPDVEEYIMKQANEMILLGMLILQQLSLAQQHCPLVLLVGLLELYVQQVHRVLWFALLVPSEELAVTII